jgi:integrase
MPRLSKTQIGPGTIKSAKPRAHRYEIRDSALTGFMLRVTPAGKKYFYVQLERGRKLKIGNAGVMTLTRARKLALDKLNAHDAGEKVESSVTAKLTLGKFIDDAYLPWAKQHQKRGEETVARIKSACNPLLTTNIGKLSELKIERWKADRLKAGLSPSTVKRDLNALKAGLNRAVKWGYASQNPAQGVKIRVEQDDRVRYLTSDERKRLLKALEARDTEKATQRLSGNVFRLRRGKKPLPEIERFADYLTPLVQLVMHTGLRRSEALSLRWEEVDLGNTPKVTVRASQAKSGKTRHIPLNSVAKEILEAWKGQGDGADLVFPNPVTGAQMEKLKTSWPNLMKKAEIKNFRFHDLRHDFASRLVMSGVDLYRVKELLGHGSIEITQRYAHLAPHTLAEAVEVLA